MLRRSSFGVIIWGVTLGVTLSHFEGGTPYRNSHRCMAWGEQQTSSSSIPRPLPLQWQVSARGSVAVPGWRGMERLWWPRAGPGVQQGRGGPPRLPSLLLPAWDTRAGRWPFGQGSDPGIAMLLALEFCNGYANGAVRGHTYTAAGRVGGSLWLPSEFALRVG